MDPEFRKKLDGLTMPLVEFGAGALGIGPDASLDAGKNGSIPTLKVNGRYFVPLAKARPLLGLPEPTLPQILEARAA